MKVGSVEIYNLTKVPRIWHQNDRELMIFHPIYDSIRLDLENQKGPKCVLIRPSPISIYISFDAGFCGDCESDIIFVGK